MRHVFDLVPGFFDAMAHSGGTVIYRASGPFTGSARSMAGGEKAHDGDEGK